MLLCPTVTVLSAREASAAPAKASPGDTRRHHTAVKRATRALIEPTLLIRPPDCQVLRAVSAPAAGPLNPVRIFETALRASVRPDRQCGSGAGGAGGEPRGDGEHERAEMKVVVTAGSRSTSAYSGSEEPRQVVLPGFWSAAGVRRRSFRAGLLTTPRSSSRWFHRTGWLSPLRWPATRPS